MSTRHLFLASLMVCLSTSTLASQPQKSPAAAVSSRPLPTLPPRSATPPVTPTPQNRPASPTPQNRPASLAPQKQAMPPVPTPSNPSYYRPEYEPFYKEVIVQESS